MRILVSNDDGVQSPGIHALAAALRKLGAVTICAPEEFQSGASSAITIYTPVTLRAVKRECWAVGGTPTDSVKLALREVLKELPDLIVSGINNGYNTGVNVLYSGTVAAALEGAQHGITSFAVSRRVSTDEDYRSEARAAAAVIRKLARRFPKAATVFNINVPPGKPRGVLFTAIEPAPFRDGYDRRRDPRGRDYFWIRGVPPRRLKLNGRPTDDWAITRGYVSVTPLRRDLTDDALLQKLSDGTHAGRRHS